MNMNQLSGLLDSMILADKKRLALKDSAAAIAEQKRLAEEDYDKLRREFEALVQKNRAQLLGDGKTAKTAKADFGFKDVQKIILEKPEKEVVAAVQKRFPATWEAYTNQKISLDKKALAARMNEKQLERIGVSVRKEAFWLRLKPSH